MFDDKQFLEKIKTIETDERAVLIIDNIFCWIAYRESSWITIKKINFEQLKEEGIGSINLNKLGHPIRDSIK